MRLIAPALILTVLASGAQAACPTTLLWRPEALAAQKARVEKNPDSAPAYAALIRDADKAMAEGPWSVMDKTKTPPSGDKHDYMSIAPYYWPDPSKPDGLPYVGRDGEVNPERATDAYDRVRLGRMASAVQALGLAYYFTGERKYAERAALVLRTWFLDPATRMNPSLTYAQGVPGKVPGRGTGIIDTAELLPVVDAIGLLQPSGALGADDMKGLRAWFGAYTDWLQTSDNGKAEHAAANNHGIWYDLQLSDYALFAGKDDVARTEIAAFADTRIVPQFTADGSMPRELARTRSFHYSTWTMQAVYDIARLGDCVGVDLWTYRSPDGKSLRRNTDFLATYAGHEDQWHWKEIDMNRQDLYDALVRASWGYRDARLGAAARAVGDYGAARITLTTPPYPPESVPQR